MLYAGKNGQCHPAHATIAREVCTPDRHVKRCLSQLRREGYISWTRTSRGNAYRLTDRTCTSYQEPERQDPQVPSDRTHRSPEVGPTGPTNRCSEKMSIKPPPPEGLAVSVGGGGGVVFSEEDERAFKRIENIPKIPADGSFRGKLDALLKAQGFTVQHLAAWLTPERLQGAKNVPGLLLAIVKEFGTRTSGFSWPSCLRCSDTAMVDEAPCACEAGQLKAAGLARKAEEQRIKDEFFKKCRREAAELEAIETARAQPFKDAGVCPGCEGKAPGCAQCNGTLVWRSDATYRELGVCTWCKGVTRMWGKSQPCMGCAGRGTNRMKTPTDHRSVACA
jgi:hypothetical protein